MDAAEGGECQWPLRPVNLEDKLINQSPLAIVRKFTGEYSGAVCDAYNNRLSKHVQATRSQLIENLLKGLLQRDQEPSHSRNPGYAMLKRKRRHETLFRKGRGSMACLRRLEDQHPHQRHIFDLATLRTWNDQNIAMSRLYMWATGGERALLGEQPLKFSYFIEPYLEYMSKRMLSYDQQVSTIDRYSASKLADYVVDFFQEYY